MAYIKALSLLIAILSSLSFPVQDFKDASFAVETSGDLDLLNNNDARNTISLNLAETKTNQIMQVSNEALISIQNITEDGNIKRITNNRNESTPVDHFSHPIRPANSTPEKLNDSQEVFVNIESKQLLRPDPPPSPTIETNNPPSPIYASISHPDIEEMLPPVPVIVIQYNYDNNYDARKTWYGLDEVDLLARSMLAEENEKLFDPDRVIDFIGAGWVMVNRTRNGDGLFPYANGDLFKALTPQRQFAIGGYIDIGGEILPGNVAFVSNPEAYPGWFGGNPRAYYWKAIEIAHGILDGTIEDPTFGALFFADAYFDEFDELIYYPDGRTRFWYGNSSCYTIPQLERLTKLPWPLPSNYSGNLSSWPGMLDKNQDNSQDGHSVQHN